jgi:hypothetical protein
LSHWYYFDIQPLPIDSSQSCWTMMLWWTHSWAFLQIPSGPAYHLDHRIELWFWDPKMNKESKQRTPIWGKSLEQSPPSPLLKSKLSPSSNQGKDSRIEVDISWALTAFQEKKPNWRNSHVKSPAKKKKSSSQVPNCKWSNKRKWN